MSPEELAAMAVRLEAWETAEWAAPAILRNETITPIVFDPCVGTGILAAAAAATSLNLTVYAMDIFNWSAHLPSTFMPHHIGDWLNRFEPLPDAFIRAFKTGEVTVLMNPPFQTACEFVDRAFELGARKIICHQRWAWRESDDRFAWWRANPPARIWLCIDRATPWLFTIPKTCPAPGVCTNKQAKKPNSPYQCRKCLGGIPYAHAFFVWERGHPGNQVICELRKAA